MENEAKKVHNSKKKKKLKEEELKYPATVIIADKNIDKKNKNTN